MIQIENRTLKDSDKGSKVTYIPPHANDNPKHEDSEGGTISSWNDTYVFVNYGYNTKATRPQDLRWG